MAELTLRLDSIQRGEAGAAGALINQVYAELRQIARAKMAREKSGHTLQPTALVHEAWLRLGDQPFENRAHFFSTAAEAMRRILIEGARRKHSSRHGAGAQYVDVDNIEIAAPTPKDEELLAIHDALDALATLDARKAELVKLRYFAGFSIDEAAEVLGISEPTAKRWWAFARAWLFVQIRGA